MLRSRAETTESTIRRSLCVFARDPLGLRERSPRARRETMFRAKHAEGPRAEPPSISTKNPKVSRRDHREHNKTSLCVFARDLLRLRERSPRARRETMFRATHAEGPRAEPPSISTKNPKVSRRDD